MHTEESKHDGSLDIDSKSIGEPGGDYDGAGRRSSIHMLFGLIVVLLLLILAVMAVFTSELRRLGAIGIVYALMLPIFGVTQQMILMRDLHWLIQAAHLTVGFGAIPFLGAISAYFLSPKRAEALVTGQPQPVQ